MNKRIILLAAAAVFLAAASPVSAKPLLGVAGFQADTVRGKLFLKMIERNINTAAYTSGAFDIINTELMYSQMKTFGCTEEMCIVSFSRDAGISVFILATAREEGRRMILDLQGFGTEIPYNGKVIAHKTYPLYIDPDAPAQTIAYLAEEVSALFLADLLE
ncbi:MAG: hypothetical protein ACRCUT_02615, partial [Spirochaetota bacterium]